MWWTYRETGKTWAWWKDKKIIQKHFGNNTHIINVAYTNYYEKIDNIYAQLAEFEGGVDYCIMDCGVLGLALMSKIWDNLNMSTIDFGKTLSLSKVTYPQPVAWKIKRIS